jgi:predicted metal-dependent hydrolase
MAVGHDGGMSTPVEPWYAVRCLFRFARAVSPDPAGTYEERITLWRARSFKEAIDRAEVEAAEYASITGGDYMDLAQAFHLAVEGSVGEGDEIFSLMRESTLEPSAYIDSYLDTGDERQGRAEGS